MPRSPRPLDAATLILVRFGSSEPEVLMGRRTARDAWHDRYVFPGGTVESTDNRVPTAAPLRPEVFDRLTVSATPGRAKALALAAVRELWEETGIRLARPTATGSNVPRGWEPFFAVGAPALDRLHYLCRAITPPARPKRFNARFFVAEAEETDDQPDDSPELQDVRWVGVEAAFDLSLPLITKAVLTELKRLLAFVPEGIETGHRTPLFKTVNGHHLRLEE